MSLARSQYTQSVYTVNIQKLLAFTYNFSEKLEIKIMIIYNNTKHMKDMHINYQNVFDVYILKLHNISETKFLKFNGKIHYVHVLQDSIE